MFLWVEKKKSIKCSSIKNNWKDKSIILIETQKIRAISSDVVHVFLN